METETGKISKGGSVPSLTEEQIREIARGMIDGTVFTSMQLRDKNLLPNVFMPLIFLDEATRIDIERSGVAECYAYMKDSTGMGINGYPTFMSMGLLKPDDADCIIEKYNRMLEALDSV